MFIAYNTTIYVQTCLPGLSPCPIGVPDLIKKYQSINHHIMAYRRQKAGYKGYGYVGYVDVSGGMDIKGQGFVVGASWINTVASRTFYVRYRRRQKVRPACCVRRGPRKS